MTLDEPDRLFQIEPAWTEHWTDLPEFVHRDERPDSAIRVYFRTDEDRLEFLELVGAGSTRVRGIWYPPKPYRQHPPTGEEGKVEPNRYPVYVISKGRWDSRLTSKSLEKLGIEYRIVVEPQEYDQYAEHIDDDKILTLPFSNLGQGSIPARNWVWQHALDSGVDRHWILDDNLGGFARLNRNENRILRDENPFVACEEFVDRYKNVGLAGLQYRMFASDKNPRAPYHLNTRIYSCILINHALPFDEFRWRGRYNEDTDLSLRVLKAGWVTVLIYSHLCGKMGTMRMKGGNTDELYSGDGRMRMAESLREQHPDVVTVTTKWGRPQHHVDYSPFRFNELIPIEIDALPGGQFRTLEDAILNPEGAEQIRASVDGKWVERVR